MARLRVSNKEEGEEVQVLLARRGRRLALLHLRRGGRAGNDGLVAEVI